jgi:hypothetical protein
VGYPGGYGPNGGVPNQGVPQWQPPAGPYQGGYGYPAPPTGPMYPPPKKGAGPIIAVLAAVVVLVIGGAAAYLFWPKDKGEKDSGASAGQEAAERTVHEPDLKKVLLTKNDLGQMFGTKPFVGDPKQHSDIYQDFGDDIPLVDADCEITAPDSMTAQQGSGWKATRMQYLQAPANGSNVNSHGETDVLLVQVATTYTDAAAANGYVDSAKPKWRRCANRAVNMGLADEPVDADNTWQNGSLSDSDNMLRLPATQPDVPDWVCTDALSAHANVVIGVNLCASVANSKLLGQLVKQMSDNVDQAATAN